MADPVTSDAPVTPLAVGWATVDLDRAMQELATSLVPGTAFVPAPASLALGARCRIGQARDASTTGAAVVVLLEPTTEGRLAATLARQGEGWCATWAAATAAGVAPDVGAGRLSSVRPGPFGPERLLLGGPVHGPHRLVVATAIIGT